MKVYLVMFTIPYESCDIEGIYSTYDKATEAMKEIAEYKKGFKKDLTSDSYSDIWGYMYFVQEHEVL